MPKAPPTFRPHGLSQQNQERLYDQARGSSTDRLYDGAWERARDAHLQRYPLCVYCQLDGYTTAASLVDHFWPHNRNRALFWMRQYWMSSCTSCHSGMKQRAERAGIAAMLALAVRLGLPPIDPRGDKSLAL